MLPITPFPNGVSEDSQTTTKDLVLSLLVQGLSVTEIAAALHISKATVCFHTRTLGIRIDSRFAKRPAPRRMQMSSSAANGVTGTT